VGRQEGLIVRTRFVGRQDALDLWHEEYGEKKNYL
jgi:hypothetical protein